MVRVIEHQGSKQLYIYIYIDKDGRNRHTARGWTFRIYTETGGKIRLLYRTPCARARATVTEEPIKNTINYPRGRKSAIRNFANGGGLPYWFS